MLTWPNVNLLLEEDLPASPPWMMLTILFLLLCFMLVGQAVAQSQDRGSCLAAAATHQSLTLQIISPAGCLHPYVRKLLVSREAHCTRLPILMCRRWCQHGGRRGGYLCTAALPSSRHEVILPHVCLFFFAFFIKISQFQQLPFQGDPIASHPSFPHPWHFHLPQEGCGLSALTSNTHCSLGESLNWV